ncbi:hypothetical protein COL82_19185 [Bacillus toyonensis]|uniref:tail fiber domain-containing protein n=1 Tax=Bacillus toyonensis TaxID=155322 RepID=UPI000BF59EBD|nr:tail fiber domain-containing protein [Bacillus toyonensis]PFZ75898.1 hypothetical protein COL82_19185 [Bacillus toyonensis]
MSNDWRAPIYGESNENGPGVTGVGRKGTGVEGISYDIRWAGVSGSNLSNEVGEGVGVFGAGNGGAGVYGFSAGFKFGNGVVGKSLWGLGVKAESPRHVALYAESGADQPTVMIHQSGTGNIITGRNQSQAEVFRVLNNGDVQVRGITITSDRNAKENFSGINPLEILDNLARMPIQSWKYKGDSTNERHIGPTAQDFHAAFGFNGDDDTHISSIDLQGVALVAIQGLNEKLKAENDELHAKLASLEERLFALESKG